MEKFNDIVVVGSYVYPDRRDVIYGPYNGAEYSLSRGRFTRNGLRGFCSLYEAQNIFREVVCRGVGLLDNAFYARLELEHGFDDKELPETGPYVILAKKKKSGLYLLGARNNGKSIYGSNLADFEENGLKSLWRRDEVLESLEVLRKKNPHIAAHAAAIQFEKIISS